MWWVGSRGARWCLKRWSRGVVRHLKRGRIRGNVWDNWRDGQLGYTGGWRW